MIFQSSLRFTAKLRGKHRDFPYTPCSHACKAFPIINISHQSGTFVTIDEHTLTHHNHPKSIVYIGVVHSVRLDKSVMTYPSLYNHTEYFHCLKIFCALPVHPSLTPNPWQPLIFLWSPQFCLFQDVTQLASYNMQPFQISFFHPFNFDNSYPKLIIKVQIKKNVIDNINCTCSIMQICCHQSCEPCLKRCFCNLSRSQELEIISNVGGLLFIAT